MTTNLIESVVQALVELFQVAQDDSAAQFHSDFNPVDVEADLLVALVVVKAGAENDGRVVHVQKILQNQRKSRDFISMNSDVFLKTGPLPASFILISPT